MAKNLGLNKCFGSLPAKTACPYYPSWNYFISMQTLFPNDAPYVKHTCTSAVEKPEILITLLSPSFLQISCWQQKHN